MHRDLQDVEFTIFDTETTGLDPNSGDRIVEIAAIKIKGSERGAVFQSLVNPRREISFPAFQVNHISQDMLRDAPPIEKIMPDFLGFIENSCLCSYNAGFDLGFLNNELALTGKGALRDIIVVDILKMARRIMPKLERHALWFVANSLGINIRQEHRALADVELTIAVFEQLTDILRQKGIHDFEALTRLFSINYTLPNDQRIIQIQQAIDLGVKLRIKYLSTKDAQVTEREILPKEIQQERNNAYLIAHCYLKNEERTFRIDGILHFEII